MHRPCPSFLHLLSLLCALLFFLPLSCCDDEDSSQSQLYNDCQERPFPCGGRTIKISYPFTDESHPKCGHPKFGFVTCNHSDDESITISIGDKEYQVKDDVDYSEHLLTLVLNDTSFVDDVCRPQNSNPAGLDPSLFSYTDVVFNASFYNCPSTLTDFPWLYAIDNSCPSNPSKAFYYWPNTSLPDYLASQCTLVQFPMNKKVVEDMITNTGRIDYEKALQDGFTVNWTQVWESCSACSTSGGVCGNGSSPSTPACYCPSGQVPGDDGTCPHPVGGGSKSKSSTGIIIGATLGAVALVPIIFLGSFLYIRRKRKQDSPILLSQSQTTQTTSYDQRSSNKESDSFVELEHPGTRLFQYEELHEATDGFNESNELGEGGFGTVYKGNLHDGRTVAIKRLYENNYKRVEQFRTEVQILSSLRHPYLVTLYGCTSRHSRELLLVYEYIPNGTVADHLHGSRATEQGLSWRTRMSIAIETAEALSFLHAVVPQIIHRDVKTNNILLDSHFHVKVADFGLSRLFPVNVTHVSTAPQGTPGYVDPEYHQCYQLTDKSDVYSFGVVLMELLASRPAVDLGRPRSEVNLACMATSKIQNGQLDQLVDPKLWCGASGDVMRMINVVAEVAFRCLQAEREMRPTMREVLDELRGVENEGLTDGAENDDECLLKPKPPGSPNTVTEKWESSKTTPNTSA